MPVRSDTVADPPVSSMPDTIMFVESEKNRKTRCAVFPQRTLITSRNVFTQM